VKLYRFDLLQKLALMPLDYIPEPRAARALACMFVQLLRFLPTHSSEDLAFVSEWSKLTFHLLCHVDDDAEASPIGAALSAFIVHHALQQHEGECKVAPRSWNGVPWLSPPDWARG
jgi:hypothetical protein